MISAIEMIFEKDLRDRLEISAKSGRRRSVCVRASCILTFGRR